MAKKIKAAETPEELRNELSNALTELVVVRSDLKIIKAVAANFDDEVNSLQKKIAALSKSLSDSEKDATFERDRANALEQRLQRMSGYLDRVMDEENQYKDPPTEVVKARPAPKGPLVHSVHLPQRETSRPNTFAYSERGFDTKQQYPERTY